MCADCSYSHVRSAHLRVTPQKEGGVLYICPACLWEIASNSRKRMGGHGLTLGFVGPIVTQRFGNILQVGIVALNQ